jgi:hypothetical protein
LKKAFTRKELLKADARLLSKSVPCRILSPELLLPFGDWAAAQSEARRAGCGWWTSCHTQKHPQNQKDESFKRKAWAGSKQYEELVQTN